MLNKIRLLGCLMLGLFILTNVSFAEEIYYIDEEIVVTALRVPRLKTTVPWQTTVISQAEIKNSGAVKLGDVVRSVSGLSIKSNGGRSSQLSARLRGSNSQQVLVLINGNRLNSPSLGTFDLGDLLLADVEKIEVVTAPLSAVYGSDAVGGVINVITKKPSATVTNQVALKYGEFSSTDFTLSSSGPHYFLSATSLYSAGFRTNSDYKAEDFNLRLAADLGETHLEAGIKKYRANKGVPGSLDFLTPQARQTDDNLICDVNYELVNLGLKFSLSSVDLRQHYQNPSSFPPVDTTNNVLTSVTGVQKVVNWNSLNSTLVGLEIRSDKSASSSSGYNAVANKAVYLQHDLTVAGDASFVAGLRGDISQSYGNYLSPRLGVVWPLGDDQRIRASWGSSFKAPTINDLYWTKLTETSDWGGVTYVGTTEGNPALRAETAQSVDLSFERSFDTGTEMRLSVFVSRINDLIRWSTTNVSATEYITSPQNVMNVQTNGCEIEIVKQLAQNLKATLNMTGQAVKNAGNDKFIDYSPQTLGNLRLEHSDCFGWAYNFSLRYVGEQFTNLANTNQLKAYTVADLSLVKDFGQLGLKLSLDNMFSENYAESYGFSDVYPMPGRRYNVGVSYRL